MTNQQPPAPPAGLQHPARKFVAFGLLVLLVVIVTRLFTYWFGVTSAWTTIVPVCLALITGALAFAREELKAKPMSMKTPIVLACLVVVALIASLITLATRDEPPAVSAANAGGVKNVDPSALPFTVAVNAYANGSCGTYLFRPGDEPSDSPRNHVNEFNSFLRDHRAVQAANYGTYGYISKLVIGITGLEKSPVTLTDVSFEIVDRSAAGLSGVQFSGQCGSSTTGKFMVVDLNKPQPTILASNADPNATWGSEAVNLEPIRFPYTVKDDDSEAFYVMAELQEGYVAYRIKIGWMYKDRVGTTTIDNSGIPFEVTKPASDSFIE
jgi:hypothetical protein